MPLYLRCNRVIKNTYICDPRAKRNINIVYYRSNRSGNSASVYRMSQEERSKVWEVTVSVILSKMCICTCALFGTISEIELFLCTVPKLIDLIETSSF
jgi:hypothetical protein